MLTVGQLLTQIATNQSTGSAWFPAGLFPAWRYNRAWGYRRPDANLFYTAISVFTLQRLRPWLTPAERALADQITNRARPAYALFRNKDGLATYNFYATNPSAHFPHGWLMHRFRHFQLPDDIDDTAMVYLTTRPPADDLLLLPTKLAQHANRTHLTVQSFFPDYRDLRAYSTWFGRQMPIEFDACALANLLYALHEYALPPDAHTHDSLTLLADLVQTNRYRADPFRCAPNYARAPLIQYHLARLMGAFEPPALQPVRPKLVADLKTDFNQTQNQPDRLLLAIALLRLGETPPTGVPVTELDKDWQRFSFFRAGMLSAYPQAWFHRWASRPFWHIRWQCNDHSRVLQLEYLVLQRGVQ